MSSGVPELSVIEARLHELIDYFELKWTTDDQPAKAAPAVQALIKGAKGRAEVTRLVQALLLNPAIPEHRRRPSAASIQAALKSATPTLAQSEQGLLWCQALAVVALENLDVGVVREAMLFLNSYGVGIAKLECSSKLATIVDAPSPPRGSGQVSIPNVSGASFGVGAAKKKVSSTIPSILKRVEEFPIDDANPRMGWSANPIRQVFGIVLQAINLLDQTQADQERQTQAVQAGMASLAQWVPRAVAEAQKLHDRETQTLWWSQSLYSRSRRASYRDLDAIERVWVMADDLLDLWGDEPEPALVAFFVETCLRLDTELNALSWTALANGAPPSLLGDQPEPLASDPTGAPIARLLGSARPEGTTDLDGLWSESGLPEASGRSLLRHLLRERQLARWLKG